MPFEQMSEIWGKEKFSLGLSMTKKAFLSLILVLTSILIVVILSINPYGGVLDRIGAHPMPL